MRGYESQGMILAASNDEGVLSVVAPVKEIGAGAQVR